MRTCLQPLGYPCRKQSRSRLCSGFLAALLLGAAAMPAVAQECGGDFEAWKQGIAAEAKAAGVGAVGLGALEAASIDDKVLARDRAQGVFAQTFIQFSNRMISAYRLKQGAANLKKYADVFARADQQFGVQAPIITAFWGLETDFGAVQGDFHTLSALVTLSHDCRRPELFRPQLVPLLMLIDRGVVPAEVTGAWAGEIGQTQILPSDYLARGVDGDGDGIVDLRRSVPDVIMTTASKVLSRGWKRDQPWIEEVRVPEDMPWEQTGRTNKLPLSQWAQWGVTNPDGTPLIDNGLKAGLALPMGRKGPAFLAYDNFDVYLEWNQSFTYALTAANFATRLAGAKQFDPRTPETGLNGDQMKELQTKLEARGYDVGTVDGILGTNTREAIRKEQMRLGLAVDGWPTPELLGKL
ncbi:lytic murein transglycosylase [Mesorhizobium sp. CCANP35]|uniref:Lytic murein transglycosylase n=2 Tax=Mesorhizobium neociceri TaxID=1307853 RepID=A0A838B0G3_9HYPH|nr:lytic murein transglycosylase [Mesorhizobium neociceri]